MKRHGRHSRGHGRRDRLIFLLIWKGPALLFRARQQGYRHGRLLAADLERSARTITARGDAPLTSYGATAPRLKRPSQNPSAISRRISPPGLLSTTLQIRLFFSYSPASVGGTGIEFLPILGRLEISRREIESQKEAFPNGVWERKQRKQYPSRKIPAQGPAPQGRNPTWKLSFRYRRWLRPDSLPSLPCKASLRRGS